MRVRTNILSVAIALLVSVGFAQPASAEAASLRIFEASVTPAGTAIIEAGIVNCGGIDTLDVTLTQRLGSGGSRSGSIRYPDEIPFCDPGVIDLARLERFEAENRPHDPPDKMPLSEVEKHQDVLVPVVQAVAAAQASGMTRRTIDAYINIAASLVAITADTRTRR